MPRQQQFLIASPQRNGTHTTIYSAHAWFVDQLSGDTMFFHLYPGARIESQRLVLEINGPTG